MSTFSWRVNGVAAVGRAPVSDADIADDPDDYRDNYLQKVTKIVPVEVVGAYTLGLQLAQGAEQYQRLAIMIGLLVFGLLGTALAMYQVRGLGHAVVDPVTRTKRRDRGELLQIAFAVGAFLVWAYVQGGAFAIGPTRTIWIINTELWPYSSAVAGILVVVYAFLISMFNPEPKVDPKTKKPNPAPPIVPPANPVIPNNGP